METMQAMLMMELSKKMGGTEERGIGIRKQQSGVGQDEEEESRTKEENRKLTFLMFYKRVVCFQFSDDIEEPYEQYADGNSIEDFIVKEQTAFRRQDQSDTHSSDGRALCR